MHWNIKLKEKRKELVFYTVFLTFAEFLVLLLTWLWLLAIFLVFLCWVFFWYRENYIVVMDCVVALYLLIVWISWIGMLHISIENWRKLGWFNLCILLMMRLRNSIVGIMCFSDDILDHWNAHLLFTGMISWNPIWFMFWSNTLYFSISLDFINFRHWNIIGKALVLI